MILYTQHYSPIHDLLYNTLHYLLIIYYTILCTHVYIDRPDRPCDDGLLRGRISDRRLLRPKP